MLFVEPPMARSTMTEFSIAASVNILRAVSPSSTMSTIRLPVLRANSSLSAWKAGTLAEPGSARPRASVMHWNVFAVPISSHEPQVAQVAHSSLASMSS